MRTMRREKREITDISALKEILDTCRVVRIGTLDEEGIYIVPVNYGYEWEEAPGEKPVLKLYIHSAKEGRKADAFARRQEVSFELDKEVGVIRGDYSCSYSFAFQSIMGQGNIRKLSDLEEKKRGLTLLMEHMEPGCSISFTDEMLAAADVYCIEASWYTGKERKPAL